MTDPKALIERLMELKHSPFCNAFGPTPLGCSCGLDEAVQAVRDLTAEVARLKALGDGLAGALRHIRIEADREQGSWVHLKRVIGINAKAALAAWEKKDD